MAMENNQYDINQTAALLVDDTFYESAANTEQAIQQKASAEFRLSWSHY